MCIEWRWALQREARALTRHPCDFFQGASTYVWDEGVHFVRESASAMQEQIVGSDPVTPTLFGPSHGHGSNHSEVIVQHQGSLDSFVQGSVLTLIITGIARWVGWGGGG